MFSVAGVLVEIRMWLHWCCLFFFQAEDGIRDLVRSRGLGDVYKRQFLLFAPLPADRDRRSIALGRRKFEA